MLRNPGFALFADYTIVGAYLPGWQYSPWDKQFEGIDIFADDQPLGVELRATVSLDFQVSPVLSFSQAVKLSLPGMTMTLTEFYANYIFLNRAFVKVGKYDYGWGISPNFQYTNLIARVPAGQAAPGDLYIARINVPISIGGFEAIGFTRNGYINTDAPELNEYAYGGKFNFAHRYIDANIGTAYFKRMPLRTFLSLKSTLFSSTEVYGEALLAVEHEPVWGEPRFSFSLGFFNDFFKSKLRINAEWFYNGEFEVKVLQLDNPLEDKKVVIPYVPGHNLALNIDFKPGGLAGLRAGVKFLYAFDDGSGQIMPGITLEPARHLRIYLAAPLVVGRRSGMDYSYFKTNSDKNNRPFSIIFAVSLNGSYEFARY